MPDVHVLAAVIVIGNHDKWTHERTNTSNFNFSFDKHSVNSKDFYDGFYNSIRNGIKVYLRIFLWDFSIPIRNY